MKRKLIASLMAATMVAGMLTGCGGGSSADDSATTDDAASGEDADVNEDGTVNNPEAVKVDENKLVFWSLFSGGDGEYMDKIISDYNDTDPDKQQIVENIVAYAHKRNMKIVAEGLETPEEIRKVLELDVDLLQGFYLARPEPIPGSINEEGLKTISEFYK